jgi:hypothetical protein
MIKAKKCSRLLGTVVVMHMGMCLTVGLSGCSTISGFRSVGTERPSLRDFWERPAGSPTPEDDAYVLSMRAGQARAAQLAKRNEESSQSARGEQTGDDEKLANADGSTSHPRSKTDSRSMDVGGESIRVSLGRPEPLPGVALALSSRKRPETGADGSPSKTDSTAAPDIDRTEAPGTVLGDRSRLADGVETGKTGPHEITTRPRVTQSDDGKSILAAAEAKLSGLNSYQMRVSRLERVNGELQPEEDILLSIRREPKAVRLEWASGPSKGREVIYSSALDPRMIFVHMPTTAIPLPVMKIPVDSPLVMRNSRHAITEAGLDTILAKLRRSEHGDDTTRKSAGTLSYLGLEKPAGTDRTCHHFVRKTASGEKWNVYLDERSLLPSMVEAHDAAGAMIEKYVYREVRSNPTDLASTGAFDPAQRWGESKGLLGRLARAAGGTTLPASDGSATR